VRNRGAEAYKAFVPHFLFMTLPTAIGTCALVWRGERIVGSFLPEADETRLVQRVRRRFPDAAEAPPPAAVAATAEAIVRLLEGEAVDLGSAPIDLEGTAEFERQVYDVALAIPPGQVRTYGEIAQAIGSPGSARAVGVALGRNPLPIIVPCHRVLAAGGRSGGFSAPGGVATKFRMLQIEGAMREEATLFDSLPLAVRPD
jgi:methylated-DNA-[protein]-cysteine S-methyltransferase